MGLNVSLNGLEYFIKKFCSLSPRYDCAVIGHIGYLLYLTIACDFYGFLKEYGTIISSYKFAPQGIKIRVRQERR